MKTREPDRKPCEPLETPIPNCVSHEDQLAGSIIGKSPHSGMNTEKALSGGGKKAPSVAKGKTPSYYLPMVLLGVVEEAELERILHQHRQSEWATKKRIAGLLLLTDRIARSGQGKTKKTGAAISSELSKDYVSPLKRAKKTRTIPQPLPLLVNIGILEIARPAIIAPHRKESARYRLHPKHGKPRKIEVMLSAQQREKLRTAEERNEKRLNRKHPFRKQLLLDLAAVGLSVGGRSLALTMMTRGEKELGIRLLMEFIDGARPREIRVDPCGTIHTFARLVPRELKRHLTLHDRPVAICDLKSAHLCVLTCIVQERIEWLSGRGHDTGRHERERQRLTSLLETSDIYEQLAEGANRDAFKKGLLTAINMPTAKVHHIEAYRRFRRTFPLTVGIIEDIKKKGHHGISRPLQHHTARIIRGAIAETQQAGIPCIPDTDALIIPANEEHAAQSIMGRFLFEVTGIQRVTNTQTIGMGSTCQPPTASPDLE